VLFLEIAQGGRECATGATGGGGDNASACRVFFTDSKGIGTDRSVLADGRRLIFSPIG
jgi:hypothetical protein